MAGIRFKTLAEMFIKHLENEGATVLVVGGYDKRPMRCRVSRGQARWDLEVFLWTVTPGGKGRGRPNERCVQMTGVNAFNLKPQVRAILGGWSEEVGVYSFWDVRRHLDFTAGSPSLQTSLDNLERAYHSGMSAHYRSVRSGDENAVAVQPDYLLWYLDEYERIYECDDDINVAADLVDATQEDERAFIDSGSDDLQQSQRHRVVSIVRNFRDARFRPSVLRAYGYRCCVSGVSLRLIDAAHIIPASESTSSDAVQNGLALSANHHRAYDSGLLGILPDGRLAVNNRVASKLQDARLTDGLDEFKAALPAHIRMPEPKEVQPRPDWLKTGLLARGWTNEEITAA